MGFGGYLQANTAVDVLIGPFIDDTDGKTAETALTLSQGDIKLSKNGQALAQKNDDTSAAHDANGYYNCELDATDTNTEGTLTLIVHESGALPVRHDFMVLAQAAYISLVTSKDTGFMDVNVKAVSEDTAAADNLELACDNYSATRGLSGTALPAAAADAAGGLPISDAGGLDLDAKLANTNEVTAARMGALTDLIDGGRLDLLIDAIKAMTDKIGTVTNTGGTATIGAILGDFANSALVTRLNTIDDFVDTEIGTLTTELAKVPKSDGSASWNATALAAINAEVDTALNTAIPASNTANSINDILLDQAAPRLPGSGTISTHSAADVKTAIEAGGSSIALIKAKTDSLTFTSGTAVDANIQKVNDVDLTGNGSTTPWGPA